MVNKHITKTLILAALLFGLQSGCARFQTTPTVDYQTVDTSAAGRPKIARKKHEKGIFNLQNQRYAVAEKFLHEALIADVSYGPAHNTLGKVYYEQGKYYLAAWEFDHAVKSMPDRAEPVNNLGLVYEAVGKLDDAILQYELAVSIEPEIAEYYGNLLRCRIRRGEHASTMRSELQTLIALDDRPEWVSWAKEKLTTDKTGQGWRQSDIVAPVHTDVVFGEEQILGEHFIAAPQLPLESEETLIDSSSVLELEPPAYPIESRIESDSAPIVRQPYDVNDGN